MYFFYIDESGTKDPEITGARKDGTLVGKEHLYVLTAVSLYERKWKDFEREITNLKLELADKLHRKSGRRYQLSECEVKSVWLRHPKERESKSPFLHALSEQERTRISETFFCQLPRRHMRIFSVIVDKRKLLGHFDEDKLFKKAYELLLERIEHYLAEYFPKHQGLRSSTIMANRQTDRSA